MAIHSSMLAWTILWTEKPGGQRLRHDRSDSMHSLSILGAPWRDASWAIVPGSALYLLGTSEKHKSPQQTCWIGSSGRGGSEHCALASPAAGCFWCMLTSVHHRHGGEERPPLEPGEGWVYGFPLVTPAVFIPLAIKACLKQARQVKEWEEGKMLNKTIKRR